MSEMSFELFGLCRCVLYFAVEAMLRRWLFQPDKFFQSHLVFL
jgi:hypothetical protein